VHGGVERGIGDVLPEPLQPRRLLQPDGLRDHLRFELPRHFAGYLTTCEPNPCLSAVDEASGTFPLRAWAAPNPGAGQIVIRYQIPVAGPVTIMIFDAGGAVVRRLSVGQQAGGQHAVTWDGRADARRDVAAGVYLVKVTTAVGETSGRVVLTDSVNANT